MNTVEKKADDIVVGDVIIAKQGQKNRYTVKSIIPGMAGPYLTLTDANGNDLEHDTSLDSRSATYTVEVTIHP